MSDSPQFPISSSSNQMHVGVISSLDPNSPKVWSGTPYFMTEALRRSVARLSVLGGIEARGLRALNKLIRLQYPYTGWHQSPSQFRWATKHNARKIRSFQKSHRADILFAPAGSTLLSDLSIDTPICYTSDATARLINEYYQSHSKGSESTFGRAEEVEQQAIKRAALLIYPTQWAADSAVNDYGADPSKVHVVPYGANLEFAPERNRAIGKRSSSTLELLFIGVDWTRKGGAIAVETAHILRNWGIDAHLTVVGCRPPNDVNLEAVSVIPFLDKRDPEQAAKLSELYFGADFFILPTMAECYGIVFSEAAAHGVPSLAPNTGGVSGAMQHGRSGFLLSEGAAAEAYAKQIRDVLGDPEGLQKLRTTSRDAYETYFNWDVWAECCLRIFEEHLTTEGARSA